MENNEKRNISSNEVNEEQNVDNSKKSEKRKTKVLMGIVSTLVLTVGVYGGIMLSGKSDFTIVNRKETAVESSEETKLTKKINEGKDWIYDAEYIKENKIVYADSKKTEEYAVKTDRDLIVPFININSEYAETVNDKIKSLYNNYYSKFGVKCEDKNIGNEASYNVFELGYEKYQNGNILSVVILAHEGCIMVDGGTGGGVNFLYTYNFNLDTLNEATPEEMAEACGFTSIHEVNKKVTDWEKLQVEILAEIGDGSEGIFQGVQAGKLYIDEEGRLNFIYRMNVASSSDIACIVEPDRNIENIVERSEHVSDDTVSEKEKKSKEKNSEDSKAISETKVNSSTEKQSQNVELDFSLMQAFQNKFYRNDNVESKSGDGNDFYEVKFDNKGNPSIKVGKKSNNNTECYFETKDVANIKTDIAAGTVYVTFDFTAWTAGGTTTGNATIRYSNVTDNNQIGVKAGVLIDGEFKRFDSNGNFVEVKKLDVTSYVFVDEFGEEATETILYGKDFSKLSGTSARGYLYYIDENNVLCRADYTSGKCSVNHLAKNVKTLWQDDIEGKIYAYSNAGKFNSSDIYENDNNIVYEE